MKNIYKQATEEKLRFKIEMKQSEITRSGRKVRNLTIEDLFDMKEEQLKQIAYKYDALIVKDRSDLFEEDLRKTKEDRLNELRVLILKDIVNTKKERRKEYENKGVLASEIRRLEELKVKKMNEKEEQLSLEELEAKIKELKNK